MRSIKMTVIVKLKKLSLVLAITALSAISTERTVLAAEDYSDVKVIVTTFGSLDESAKGYSVIERRPHSSIFSAGKTYLFKQNISETNFIYDQKMKAIDELKGSAQVFAKSIGKKHCAVTNINTITTMSENSIFVEVWADLVTLVPTSVKK